MKDRDIQHALKRAYEVPPSDKRRKFIRKHEQRKMQWKDVLCIEIRYMGIGSIFAGILLSFVLLLAWKSEQTSFIWMLSSILPVCALIPMTALGRSEHSGMHELELASRFSLRFVKLVRMLILGVTSFILLAVSGVCMYHIDKQPLLEIMFCTGFPYLFNVCGSLWLIRKWHVKENIFGCMGITVVSAVFPVLMQMVKRYVMMSEYVIVLMMIAVLAVTLREVFMYIRESEIQVWN